MNRFANYFLVSLAIQGIIVTKFVMIFGNEGAFLMSFLVLPESFMDVAYVLYGIPSIILFSVFQLPVSPNAPLAFVICLIPAIFYSLIFSSAAVLVFKCRVSAKLSKGFDR
jgi:hypothetical protein